MRVARNEDRRNPSTQTPSRAVTVNFPLARIHHAQVALAVYDLPPYRDSSQVARRLLNRGCSIDHSDGAGCYFHHCSALTVDQLALQTDLLAIEASYEVVSSMLSGRDQQIARIFVLLPGLSRTRD